MANFYYDFEFIEGFTKPFLGKPRHFIDMISVGFISDQDKIFSAISSEYNYKDAQIWVVENVINPLYIKTVHGDNRNFSDTTNFHKRFGYKNSEIADDLIAYFNLHRERHGDSDIERNYFYDGEIALYSYFADYNHVLMSSLFGFASLAANPCDWPSGLPEYTIDLKQMLDEKALQIANNQKGAKWNFGYALEWLMQHPEFPKQPNGHDTMDDAKWNRKLHQFLINEPWKKSKK